MHLKHYSCYTLSEIGIDMYTSGTFELLHEEHSLKISKHLHEAHSWKIYTSPWGPLMKTQTNQIKWCDNLRPAAKSQLKKSWVDRPIMKISSFLWCSIIWWAQLLLKWNWARANKRRGYLFWADWISQKWISQVDPTNNFSKFSLCNI